MSRRYSVGRFCNHWLQPNTPLQEKIHAIWLEFDIAAAERDVPPPSIFVGFAGVGDPAYYQELAETAVGLLQANLLAPAFRQNLAACFTNLPAPANLFSIGLMLARGYDRARVCIGRLPPAGRSWTTAAIPPSGTVATAMARSPG